MNFENNVSIESILLLQTVKPSWMLLKVLRKSIRNWGKLTFEMFVVQSKVLRCIELDLCTLISLFCSIYHDVFFYHYFLICFESAHKAHSVENLMTYVCHKFFSILMSKQLVCEAHIIMFMFMFMLMLMLMLIIFLSLYIDSQRLKCLKSHGKNPGICTSNSFLNDTAIIILQTTHHSIVWVIKTQLITFFDSSAIYRSHSTPFYQVLLHWMNSDINKPQKWHLYIII